MKRKGVVKGQTIVFDEALGLPEGQAVEVEVNPVEAADLEQYGFKVIPAGGNVVTREMVNKIRDELGF